jgi:hypothetical protein
LFLTFYPGFKLYNFVVQCINFSWMFFQSQCMVFSCCLESSNNSCLLWKCLCLLSYCLLLLVDSFY